MDYSSQIYSPSNVYRSFELIDQSSYHTVIRFFEENEEMISGLDFEEYFEILVAYVQSLFQIGAYQKHIRMADVVVEASIINNLSIFNGNNVFEKTLFQKSASHYNLQDYNNSIHILTELIKINPRDPNYKSFWIRNQIQKKPALLQTLQGISISLFFVTILLISISTFYIEPFKPEWIDQISTYRNIAFSGAVIFLLGSDGIHRLRAFYLANKLVSKSIEKMKHS